MLKKVNNKILLYLNIIFKLIDVITTVYCVKEIGVASEANPIVRYMINNYGLIDSMVIIFLIHIFLIYILYRMNKRTGLVIATYLIALVALSNIAGMYIVWIK